MDKETALRETIQLWDALARKPGVRKDEIPGPWRKYVSVCPCCEYSKTGIEHETYCAICPMFDQWNYFEKPGRVPSHTGPVPCCFEHSPYWRWGKEMDLLEDGCRPENEADYYLRSSEYDIEFFCLLIVELAKEALKELPGK